MGRRNGARRSQEGFLRRAKKGKRSDGGAEERETEREANRTKIQKIKINSMKTKYKIKRNKRKIIKKEKMGKGKKEER